MAPWTLNKTLMAWFRGLHALQTMGRQALAWQRW